MQERRQNVRVRPIADYDIGIDFGAGVVKFRLSVVNVAVGGVALVLDEQLKGVSAGDSLRLGVKLPGVPRFETVATVRYAQSIPGGRCGVCFDNLSQEQQNALSRAVSELLERGCAV
jgi:c-di-GMP-binding flagellar brake protein YcgR